MLLQPSVSRFSKTKLQLNHSKNMFNFGAYRGFLMLTAFDLCLGACGVLLTLAGTAIDFVVDRLTGLVLLQRSWSLLRSEIAAVPIDLFLISGKKFRGHRNIMLVGSCHFYRMNQTTFFIYSDMGFIAKVPYISFFCRVSLRVTLFHFARNLWVFCTKVHGGAWDFIGWFLQRAGYYTITTPFYGKETGYDTNILPFKTFAPSTG